MRNCDSPMRILGWLAEVALCLAATVVWAQQQDLGLPLGAGQDSAGVSLGAGDGVLGEGDRVPKLEAGFTVPGFDRSAQLFIVAALPRGAHTYSITQTPGGPLRTEIKVKSSEGVFTVGKFQTVGSPEIERDEEAFPGIVLESHTGTVKWVAPIQLARGVKPETLKIDGSVNMQLCDAKGCAQPKDYPFSAALRTDVPAVAIAASQGQTEAPATGLPGGSTSPSIPPAKPSLVNSSRPAPTNSAASSAPPTATNSANPAERVKPRAATGDGEIDWLPLADISELRQIVGPGFDAEQVRENVREQAVGFGIVGAIFAGFLGGLIFNIMPCVLPVIGLKILSFVQQAGHNRRKAFMLNVWYSAGLLAVFFIFASLAVGPQHLGWGELFGKAWFAITLTAVVFVMALSFMGVWEVPLPTFLGRGKAGELAAQEGAVGAFFKGVLTTFLATPCGAPIFAPALVWATAQPAWLTYAVLLSAGLGMASPYLLVGAFPELLRFLPKPGAWMETFKIFMGFVLMGTVVYLLAVLQAEYVVPTVGLLFGLSFMCWWIGRIPPLADFIGRLRAWSQGAAIVCVIWIVMFPGLDERVLGRYHFPGLATVMAKRFAPARTSATKEAASGVVGPKTVLVAFTADWCPTCHYYENTVLNTDAVIESLRRLGVVTVKADWSRDSPEVSAMLYVLNSKQIPVIAIFSAHDPNHPSVFRAGYTQEEILRALEKAGPSPM
ncbi:MAG: cytochrome c biogenesis protein CcdA [Thermoguttaceae bacterium]